jgi:Rrf2 family protein
MLSQRTRYTIRALLHLADRYGQGPVQMSEIASAQNIPPKFLTVMLSQMIREGLVMSRRGREGGYWLAREPSKISYGEVVRLTRGSLGLLPCASRLAYEECRNCISEDQCRLHRVMLMVRDETARILDGLSLADAVPEDPFLAATGLDEDAKQRPAAVAFAQADRPAMSEDDLTGEA